MARSHLTFFSVPHPSWWTLALLLQAFFLSNDRKALRAVYGDADLAEHHRWVDVLKAGGDAGELGKLFALITNLVTLAGKGMISGARRMESLRAGVLADFVVHIGNRTGLLLRQRVRGTVRAATGMNPWAEERDDAALLRAVARGDDESLAVLYDRHAGWLTVRMNCRCAMPDVVDQAVQDTFLALWRRPDAYRGGGDVAAFIWGIGIRRLIDAIRRENGAGRLPWRSAEPEAVVSAEEQVLIGIEHGRLGQALAALSPELRAAIEATVLDGLTCAEAAVLLGVAEGTVKSRCHRARVALRAALADPSSGPDRTAHRRQAWGTS